MYPYYYPSSSSFGTPYTSSSDADYLRALAEERAAREQYAAARRAQEEARQRAARARAARRAYAAPYNSYHDDEYDDMDLDMDLDDGAYYPQRRPVSWAPGPRSFGYPSTTPQLSTSPQFSSYATSPQFANGAYGLNPRSQRALLEEQRRRELLEEQRRRELLELEKERRRQEEERLRRILQEERQREEAERRKLLEEERMRRAIEEEKLRRAIEEEKLRRAMLEEEAARRERERAQLRAQQATLEPLLRAFGFVPVSGSDSESDKERPGRDARNGRATRARTMSPAPHRVSAPRSPIRQTQSSQSSTAKPQTRVETPRQKSPAPATTIPITSPRSSPKTSETPKPYEATKPDLPSLDNPTPEQVTAAEKIQDAYRTYSARKQAMKSISALRKRFLTARSNFTLPTTLDYEVPSNGTEEDRSHTTVTVDPSAALPSPSLSAADAHDEDPFKHVPKLAYTPTNASLHAYEEELNRILSALDAVESRGDAGVRAARRELARMVEREAERVERWRGVVWNWWTGRSQEQPQPQAEQSAATEPASAEKPEEQEMQVEESLSLEAPVEQPMETEPVVEESTPKAAPMEVEPQPEPEAQVEAAVSAEPEQAPTPEVDIPDADEPSAPTVDIEVEPPSRAEPADVDVPIVEATEEEPPLSAVSEPERASTPALSHDQSEVDAEMEVEPEEVHTPPPGDHTPLVVVSPPALDLNASEAPLPEDARQQQDREPQQKLPPPASVVKDGASPLVDRTWDEFHTYDMF
ncbi:hypothetical protein ONZ51_g5628 [Trametes cubensis]|uniref:BAG domain-containing protein n=1 Tax=Trametes cubensis TaxID=1111947 RepID=A0AAD7TTK8_9APHY|nr:hypothetical protein ONZ51_g5628 [Trametes cubensis]